MEDLQCCSCAGLARRKERLENVLRCRNLFLTTQRCPGQPQDLLPALEISPQQVRPRDHRAPSLATVNCTCLGRCRGSGDADSDFSQSSPSAVTGWLCLVWCEPCSLQVSLQPLNRDVSKEQTGSILCCSRVLFLRWTGGPKYLSSLFRDMVGKEREKYKTTNPTEKFLCRDCCRRILIIVAHLLSCFQMPF